MSTTAFAASRDDGRSDRRVIFELVESAEPGTVFTHQEIEDALNEGLDQPVTKQRIYQAVGSGNKTLLTERKRYLDSIPGKGYKIIHTSEAVAVSLGKKERAQTMLRRGVDVLRNARLDELDANQRQLHEGQLLVMAGLYTATKESDQRHAKNEELIASLTGRVESLEKGRDES